MTIIYWELIGCIFCCDIYIGLTSQMEFEMLNKSAESWLNSISSDIQSQIIRHEMLSLLEYIMVVLIRVLHIRSSFSLLPRVAEINIIPNPQILADFDFCIQVWIRVLIDRTNCVCSKVKLHTLKYCQSSIS